MEARTKFRLRVMGVEEMKVGQVYMMIAVAENPKYPTRLSQKPAMLEIFEPPAMEWTPIDVVVLP